MTTENEQQYGFETLALHGGQAPDPATKLPRSAHLPDHGISLQRRGSRLKPLQSLRDGEHLHAHHEPDE